jgi:hypothetical protein
MTIMHGRCIGGISGLVAAFGPLASDTEVALRNTIHKLLSLHFGRTDWWASPDLILDDTTTDVLSAAARDHQRKIGKGTVGAGKVIAASITTRTRSAGTPTSHLPCLLDCQPHRFILVQR